MNKYLDENGLAKVADYVNGKEPLAFKGTQAEWNALTAIEKAQYTIVYFTDVVGEGGAVVVDEVTDGNLNPVTSNAVAEAIGEKIKKTTYTITTDSSGYGYINVNEVGMTKNDIIPIFIATTYDRCVVDSIMWTSTSGYAWRPHFTANGSSLANTTLTCTALYVDVE